MAFDWTAPDNDAPRLTENAEHDVQITRIIFTKKGQPLVTSNGDPKIMLIMADDNGCECVVSLTLTEKAGWLLKSILGAGGADMEAMKRDGVEPSWFADEVFATKNLVGKRLRIRVKSYVGIEGNLAEIAALRPRPGTAPTPTVAPSAASKPAAPPANPPEAPPSDTDDIPF